MLFLNDVLSQQSLTDTINELGRKSQEHFGLPKIHQLGLVVSNAEKASEELVKNGLEPAVLASVKTKQWIENGQQRDYALKVGFTYHQGLEFELIEPFEGSNFHRKDIDPNGKIVLQHLGFLVDDLDYWIAKMASQGAPLAVRGKGRLGAIKADFAYFNTYEQTGVTIELISMKLLGFSVTPFEKIMNKIARYQVKSGNRCLAL